MRCCSKCFGDRDLGRQVIASRSQERGKCPTCGSDKEHLIEAKALGDYFYSVIGAYEPDDGGKTLVEWLSSDWALFPSDKISAPLAAELLANVLDDADIVKQRFAPIPYSGANHRERWEKLRVELMHRNRFFPDSELSLDRLSELLTFLEMDSEDVPAEWFRARIEKEGVPYPPDKMGAPPEKIATHGRANPVGIPYLYLGSETATAVAEVRPHPGEVLSVAKFGVDPSKLSLIDLRRPKASVSPFMVEDVTTLRADVSFLDRLGDELKTPVIPGEAAIAYVPSQYLCEYIKRDGYDGVVYGSSVSSGINLALFHPTKAAVAEVSEYTVTKVDFTIEPKSPSLTPARS